MRLAVLSTDFRTRRDTAKEIARENVLPLIAVQEGILQKLKDPKIGKNSEVLLAEMLDRQIKKQVFYNDGFVSSGSTLDYVALYKAVLDRKDNGKANVLNLIKARMHAWRHLDKIVYIPAINKEDEFLTRYDCYLQAELELIKTNTSIQIVVAKDGWQPSFLALEGTGVNGAAIASGTKENLGTV